MLQLRQGRSCEISLPHGPGKRETVLEVPRPKTENPSRGAPATLNGRSATLTDSSTQTEESKEGGSPASQSQSEGTSGRKRRGRRKSKKKRSGSLGGQTTDSSVQVEKSLDGVESLEPLGIVNCMLGKQDTNEINLSGTLRQGNDSLEVSVLLDTGAEKSFVNARLLRHFPHLDLSPTVLKIRTLSGELIPAMGSAHLELEVSGKRISHEFVFMEMTEDVVMGMDLVGTHKIEWSWDDRCLRMGNESVSCDLPKVGRKAVRVVAKESVLIPANSELVVWASIVGREEEAPHEGLISAQVKFLRSHPVAIAGALVKRQGSLVPIRFLNPTGEIEQILVGENLAVLSEISEVEQVDTMGRKASGTSSTLPEPLEKLVGDIGDKLSDEQLQSVRTLLLDYRDVFALSDDELGRTNLVEHTIHLAENAPIKQKVRREPIHHQGTVKEEIDKMLAKDVIEPSDSPWASPIVLVKKKDGSVRFCIDYRKLNDVTVKDAYPLPNIEDNIDALKGAKWFSTLDLASGYWQVAMDENDRAKTAFCTKYGLFQWKVMPFGLCNAPSTFERLMERVLQGLQWESAVLYLNDVIVFGSDFDQHLSRLQTVLAD